MLEIEQLKEGGGSNLSNCKKELVTFSLHVLLNMIVSHTSSTWKEDDGLIGSS